MLKGICGSWHLVAIVQSHSDGIVCGDVALIPKHQMNPGISPNVNGEFIRRFDLFHAISLFVMRKKLSRNPSDLQVIDVLFSVQVYPTSFLFNGHN